MTRLGNLIKLAKVIRCGTNQYPVLSMTMHDGIMLQSDRFKKSLASVDQSDYKVVNYGQLAVGFPIDEGVLYIQRVVLSGIMSPAYSVWDVNYDIVDPLYLELSLHSPQAMQYYKENLRGTTARRRSIPADTLLALPLRLPPLEKQRKIAAVLDKVSDLIAKRRQQLDKLDEMVKSRFVEMFGDPVTNPKGWKIDQLGSYMTTLTDFSANGSYELLDSNVVMYDEPSYAVMVRTIDLEAGNLDNGVKYIDQKAYELLSKSKLYGGELIMNKIGSAGKIYIMPHIGKPASLGRNAFMFRFDERINMVFLYALLLTMEQ